MAGTRIEKLEGDASRKKLGLLLKRFNGRAHALVHPFFGGVENLPPEYAGSLKAFLCRPGDNPVLVFEEANKMGETEERLKEWRVGKPVFLVATKSGFADPVDGTLLERLPKLGLRQAVLGGMRYRAGDWEKIMAAWLARLERHKGGNVSVDAKVAGDFQAEMEFSRFRRANIMAKVQRLDAMGKPANEANGERVRRLEKALAAELKERPGFCVGRLYHLLAKNGVAVSINPRLVDRGAAAGRHGFWNAVSDE